MIQRVAHSTRLARIGAVFAFALAFALAQSSHAQSVPSAINISGGLFNANGTPVLATNVGFHIEVLDKNKSCLLYAEDHLGQNLSQTKGAFSLQLGSGTTPVNKLQSSTAFTAALFVNGGPTGAFPDCPTGVNMVAGDERLIRVHYNLGSGFVAMTPEVPIVSAAYAMVADTLRGKAPSDFVQTGTEMLTQPNVANIFSNINYPKLNALVNGTSTQYMATSPSAPVSFNSQRLTGVADPTSAQDAATKNYTDTFVAGKQVDVSGVGLGVGNGKTLVWDQAANKWVAQAIPNAMSGVVAGNGLQGGTITSYGTISVDVGTTGNKIVQLTNGVLPMVDGSLLTNVQYPVTSVAGRTGAVTLNAADIGGLGTAATKNYGTAAGNLVELASSSQLPALDAFLLTNVNATYLQSRAISSTAPTAGQILGWNNSTSKWEPQTPAVAGITALTGDVTATGPGSVAATLGNDKVTSSKINSVGFAANRLLITDATTGGTVTYATCSTDGYIMKYTAALGWNCAPDAGASGVVTSVMAGTGLVANTITSTGTLNVDVGIGANQIVQLTASAKYPAVDGFLISNLNVITLQNRALASTAPAVGQVIGWSGTQWQPLAITSGTVGSVISGTGLVANTITSNGTINVDVGTTANKILQVTAGNQYPAVDGNLISNVNAVKLQARDIASTAPTPGQVLGWNSGSSKWEPVSTAVGSVTQIVASTGLIGGTINSTGTISVDVGTSSNQIVQLTAGSQYPAVDGFLISNLNVVTLQSRALASTAPAVGQVIGWSGTQWQPLAITSGTVGSVISGTGLVASTITSNGTINVDVGTTANKILQVTAGNQYPAVDGNLISNVNAVKLQARDVASTAPTPGQVLGWNSSSSKWEPVSTAIGSMTGVVGGTGLVAGTISNYGTLNVDVGTTGNKIVQLTAGAQYPAVDGFLITNLNVITLQNRALASTAPAVGQVIGWSGTQWQPLAVTSGTVASVISGTGLVAGTITNNGTVNVDVGTTGNKIVQLTAGSQYPAVDGNLISNINAVKIQSRDVSATAPAPGQVLGWNNSSSKWEPVSATAGSMTGLVSGTGLVAGTISSYGTLNVDVGTSANQILQLTAASQIPAVDGFLVSNLNVKKIQNRLVAATLPTANQVLTWNGSQWEPQSAQASTNSFVNGGNSFLSNANIGLTDNYALTVITNNLPRMTVTAAGNVGIGSTAPQAILDVNGTGTAYSAMIVPRDTIANRPSGINGMIRYNSQINRFEGFENGQWGNISAASAGISSAGVSGALQYSNGSGGFLANNNIVIDGTNGRVGIGNSSPTAVLTVGTTGGTGDGTILALGNYNSGPILSAAGAGTRMIWYPRRAALRAGVVSGTNWDDANIGDYSVALGYGGKASGQGAVALGSVVASGGWSTSSGWNNMATGDYSSAFGTGAVASGTYSLAWGTQASASSANSVALGTNVSVSGANSIAIGASPIGGSASQVTGANSVAVFLGDANSANVTANNVMGILGGSVAIGTASPQAVLDVYGTGTLSAILVPRDTAGNRPTGVNGMIRYNTSTSKMEVFQNNGWVNVVSTAGSTLGTSGAIQGSDGAGGFVSNNNLMVDTINGRVGIGTTTPAFPLTIGSTNSASDSGILALGNLNVGATLAVTGTGARMIWYPKKAAFRAGGLDGTNPNDLTSAYWNDGNIGLYSIGLGRGCGAVGTDSFCAGPYSVASGSSATAIGPFSSASGMETLAINHGNAVGNYSTAMNNGATYGSFAVSVGYNTRASGDYSVALGSNASTGSGFGGSGGNYSMAIGLGATAGTAPYVSGTNSLGIFMGDQSGATLLSSNTMAILGGQVGIGTLTPQAVLDIYGTGTGQSAVLIPRDTAGNRPAGVNGMIRYNTSTSKMEAFQNGVWTNVIASAGSTLGTTGAIQGSDGAGGFLANNNLMIDATNGRLGIGTTSPAVALDVTGAILATGTITSNSGSGVQLGIGYVRPAGPSLTINDQWSNNANISSITLSNGQQSQTSGQYNAVQIKPTYNQTSGTSANTDLLINRTETAIGSGTQRLIDAQVAGVTKFNVTNNGIGYFASNVGIGTTAPQSILDINGTGSGQSAVIVPRDTAGNRPTGVNGMIRYNTSTSKIEAFQNGTWTNVIASAGSTLGTSGAIQGSDGAGGFLSNNNLIVDTTNGRIGVGTTTPSVPLEVSGEVAVGSLTEAVALATNTGAAYTVPNASVNIRRLTLDSSTTITLPAFAPSAVKMYSLTIILKQDATGGRTVTWAGNGSDTIQWDIGTAPVISSAANAKTIIQLIKASDESIWYGMMVWREN